MLVGGLLLEVDNSKLIHLSSDSSITFLVSPAVRTLLSVGAVSAWCFALRGEYQSKGWDPIFFFCHSGEWDSSVCVVPSHSRQVDWGREKSIWRKWKKRR